MSEMRCPYCGGGFTVDQFEASGDTCPWCGMDARMGQASTSGHRQGIKHN